MLRIDIMTPFPRLVDAVTSESILGRAIKKDFVNYHIHNLFDFADPPHYKIDDYPFGGGSGMIMKPEPVFRAVEKVQNEVKGDTEISVIFPTPDGVQFTQNKAGKLSEINHLIFICGHYKGIDQRIRDELVTDEISIGDYVVTGGELPALIILDATVRLIPGVLNSYESAETDSFMTDLLDCPHYTRPNDYKNLQVPEVLISGNHGKIAEWQKKKREEVTRNIRPDLWKNYKETKQ